MKGKGLFRNPERFYLHDRCHGAWIRSLFYSLLFVFVVDCFEFGYELLTVLFECLGLGFDTDSIGFNGVHLVTPFEPCPVLCNAHVLKSSIEDESTLTVVPVDVGVSQWLQCYFVSHMF